MILAQLGGAGDGWLATHPEIFLTIHARDEDVFAALEAVLLNNLLFKRFPAVVARKHHHL